MSKRMIEKAWEKFCLQLVKDGHLHDQYATFTAYTDGGWLHLKISDDTTTKAIEIQREPDRTGFPA